MSLRENDIYGFEDGISRYERRRMSRVVRLSHKKEPMVIGPMLEDQRGLGQRIDDIQQGLGFIFRPLPIGEPKKTPMPSLVGQAGVIFSKIFPNARHEKPRNELGDVFEATPKAETFEPNLAALDDLPLEVQAHRMSPLEALKRLDGQREAIYQVGVAGIWAVLAAYKYDSSTQTTLQQKVKKIRQTDPHITLSEARAVAYFAIPYPYSIQALQYVKLDRDLLDIELQIVGEEISSLLSGIVKPLEDANSLVELTNITPSQDTVAHLRSIPDLTQLADQLIQTGQVDSNFSWSDVIPKPVAAGVEHSPDLGTTLSMEIHRNLRRVVFHNEGLKTPVEFALKVAKTATIQAVFDESASQAKADLQGQFIEGALSSLQNGRQFSLGELLSDYLVGMSLGVEDRLLEAWKSRNWLTVMVGGRRVGIDGAKALVDLVKRDQGTVQSLSELNAEQTRGLAQVLLTVQSDIDHAVIGKIEVPILEAINYLSAIAPQAQREAFIQACQDIGSYRFPFIPELMPWYQNQIRVGDKTLFPLIAQALYEGRNKSAEARVLLKVMSDEALRRAKDVHTIDDFLIEAKSLLTLESSVLSRSDVRTMELVRDSGKVSPQEAVKCFWLLNELQVTISEAQIANACSNNLPEMKARIEAQGLQKEVADSLLKDVVFYSAHGERRKIDVFEYFLSHGADQSTMALLMPLLRRVRNHDLAIIDSSQSISDPSQLLAQLSDMARASSDRFFETYESSTETWENLYIHEHGDTLVEFAKELLSSEGVPYRLLKTVYWGDIPVPRGMRSTISGERMSGRVYVPRIAALLYQHITSNHNMLEIQEIVDRMAKEAYNRNYPSYSQLNEYADENRDIAQSFWKYVSERAAQPEAKKFILWLNESTADRYFSRDQADPEVMRALNIVQGIDDRQAFSFLSAKRTPMWEIANLIRKGKGLSESQTALVESAKKIFGVSEGTRVLPLRELKIKSGANAHNMKLTVPVMEDVLNLAEILGMDIVFADVSSSKTGRSQMYARSFFESRGLEVAAEGRLQTEWESKKIVNPNDSDDRIFTKDGARKIDTKVKFINYDPNDLHESAFADDASGFTVREMIDPNGIYAHTSESMMLPSLDGGFSTIEKTWKQLIIEPVMVQLRNNLSAGNGLPEATSRS